MRKYVNDDLRCDKKIQKRKAYYGNEKEQNSSRQQQIILENPAWIFGRQKWNLTFATDKKFDNPIENLRLIHNLQLVYSQSHTGSKRVWIVWITPQNIDNMKITYIGYND